MEIRNRIEEMMMEIYRREFTNVLEEKLFSKFIFEFMHANFLDDIFLAKAFIVLDKGIELGDGDYRFMKSPNMDDVVSTLRIAIERAYDNM
ncbi:MAG: hypothetical protein ACRCX2_12785 [Paraclostridium sp.]